MKRLISETALLVSGYSGKKKHRDGLTGAKARGRQIMFDRWYACTIEAN
jgi:hypothetical protein